MLNMLRHLCYLMWKKYTRLQSDSYRYDLTFAIPFQQEKKKSLKGEWQQSWVLEVFCSSDADAIVPPCL